MLGKPKSISIDISKIQSATGGKSICWSKNRSAEEI